MSITPLTETEDVEPLDLESLAAYKEDLRNLVISGGNPYILLTVVDPETGKTELSAFGIDPAVLPGALREIADGIEADQA